MADLSIFIDESGADGLSSRYYLITLVLHDQSNTLSEGIGRYEAALANKGLPNIPFHASPLLNGHGQDYRLSQAADYICTIELTELKYLSGTQTATDERFFGGHVKFKKGPLKEARAKRLGRS